MPMAKKRRYEVPLTVIVEAGSAEDVRAVRARLVEPLKGLVLNRFPFIGGYETVVKKVKTGAVRRVS